jgi:GNAT superfamily N-acetyltransferase
MFEPKPPNQASTDEFAALAQQPLHEPRLTATSGKSSSLVVPIRSLGVNHRDRIANHLKALDERDRYLRFGFMANDTQVQRYVDGLDFERDDIFGIYNRRLDLLAMAHLAFSVDGGRETCVEFGVSVLKSARGRGYGARLFERAAMHARNEGVSRMLIHALTENTAMLKIARNAGATVERDGSESEAHLRLVPATFDSRVSELLQEQIALADYRIKVQAKHLREVFSGAKPGRTGVTESEDVDHL